MSPHRRAIQTAVNILGAYKIKEDKLHLTLFPLCKEIVSNGNDLPVSRGQLNQFIREIEDKHPKIKIDTSVLDQVQGHPNLWFLDILQDESLKKELLSKIEASPGPSDINHVHQVLLEKYREGQGIEGNYGIFSRV